jgi:hypothetical protein
LPREGLDGGAGVSGSGRLREVGVIRVSAGSIIFLWSTTRAAEKVIGAFRWEMGNHRDDDARWSAPTSLAHLTRVPWLTATRRDIALQVLMQTGMLRVELSERQTI